MAMSWTLIFRLAAVAILLLTGVELFACDILESSQCESFGMPGTSPDQQDDNCICCCTHIVVTQTAMLEPQSEQVMAVSALNPTQPHYDPSAIYHPPRA